VIEDESDAAATGPDPVGADVPPPDAPAEPPPLPAASHPLPPLPPRAKLPPPLTAAVTMPAASPPAAPSWRWPQVLFGTIVAYVPWVLLAVFALFAGSGGGTTNQKASLALAATMLVLTALLDGWQIFSAWIFSLRRGRQSWSAWGFRRPTLAIFWLVPVALIGIYAVAIVNGTLVHPPEQSLVSDFPHTHAGLALFLLTVCVAAPFFEETFFRGFIFGGLANSWGAVPAAIVSSAFFSAMHTQLTIFLPIFALGIALCWLYERTGSIWTNITLHSAFNLISVLLWWTTK
jgi:membrane protease YdiL (CAAX protease family)